MKSFHTRMYIKRIFQLILLLSVTTATAQYTSGTTQKSDFWTHVQFGGAFALNFGSNYTEVTLAPGALYNFNPYFGLGVGLQGTYVSSKNSFDSSVYGASVIGIFNPMPQIQLSAEVEELHVHTSEEISPGVSIKDDFWNTALFLGLGYRNQNVTFGVRYNVLYNPNRSAYSDAFMPFVRVYF